jgi:hypothetical protein
MTCAMNLHQPTARGFAPERDGAGIAGMLFTVSSGSGDSAAT